MSVGVVKATRKPLYCSFCGKEQAEVGYLVSGPAVFICNECVELCREIGQTMLVTSHDQQEFRTGDDFGGLLKPSSNAAPIDRSGSRGPGYCGHRVSLNEHCDECLTEREAEFASLHHRGEWFRDDPRIRAYIEARKEECWHRAGRRK